jgi:hypothetical protein
MSDTIEGILKEYISIKMDNSNRHWIGCGAAGLISFYRAIGVEVPKADDLSENLINAYQFHVRKNLNPAWAELCLLDFKAYLHFLFEEGLSLIDFSLIINPDLIEACRNDFLACDLQKWKS